MTRIYQTIIVTLALLFSVQGAQAVTAEIPTADVDFGLLAIGGSYSSSDDITIPQCGSVVPCDDRVVWFEFELDGVANVYLDTNQINVEDSVMALYDDDTAGTLLGQNDDCLTAPENEFWSCLSYSNLQQGTYLVGVSLLLNTFSDGWMLTSENQSNENEYAGLNITVSAVSAVPIPAAIWLFGTALIGFVGMSRRTSVKA